MNQRRSAHASLDLLATMASRGGRKGLGGSRIGERGDRDHIIHRPVLETPDERRARICSEAVKKRAVHKYTNHSVTPSQSLAPYVAYATGASSLHCCPRCPTPPPSSSSSDDEADFGRVIGPEDFVKDPAEEERAMAEALPRRRRRSQRSRRWRRSTVTPHCAPSRLPGEGGRLRPEDGEGRPHPGEGGPRAEVGEGRTRSPPPAACSRSPLPS
jgi:hypothetical protein